MPLEPSFVGRSYPPSSPYLVGREKVREFAVAIGATDPIHHDPAAARAAGYPDVVAPPTFPIVITMASTERIVTDPQLGVDYTRVVHGDQRFRYARPVVAGDELVCVDSIDDIVSRSGHDFLTTRTEVATMSGEPVVTVWMKLVVRGED
ncbi:MaoC family dehydratase N-terminal domain-containing protein [Solwaraspora sp. WMMD406]|uniref:MaoC family dehydratase N-terminal domain-containing protein n=1 Tax=Solwaraspora sp. WMMD406 TaxID=3016095 RepID=UPI002417C33D|nr:MaoC family dehydratase N-terminal domain-containing protein [Solwaraspora sp. WMMD406]MDG4763646.1 MaoC family dehydratase N-terminal domain-containing protein [Solwaraspora sp. WMMD406]